MNNQKYTNVGDMVKEAMACRRFTQSMVGEILYGTDGGGEKQGKQNWVAERLRKADMKVSTLVQILDVIGCDLIITERVKQGGEKWQIKLIDEESFSKGKRKRVKKEEGTDA